MLLTYKKTRPVKDPRRENATDSGLDIFSPEEFDLFSEERKLIPTGLIFNIPKIIQSQLGFSLVPELQIRSKSGLAYHDGLIVLNSPGTIDNSYMKELSILIFNSSKELRKIKEGQKIAQLIMNYVLIPELKEVQEFPYTNTNRNGFGSTGLE